MAKQKTSQVGSQPPASHQRNSRRAVNYPATLKLTSRYFGGQIELSGSQLTVIQDPVVLAWFNGGTEKDKVKNFQLFFEGNLVAPHTYPLSYPGDYPVFMDLTILDDSGYPQPCFIQSGDVILDVFDRDSGHIQGRLENIVVEIKMGQTITITEGFFSSPPN